MHETVDVHGTVCYAYERTTQERLSRHNPRGWRGYGVVLALSVGGYAAYYLALWLRS